MRHKLTASYLAILSLMSLGCSITVPQDEVYGTYVASYPFGNETLTLNRDQTFLQQAVINGQAPVTAHGRWVFDSADSRVNFYGSMQVVDGIGHLRSDWRTIGPGLTGSMSVERIWFRVQIGSGGEYPYVKR